MSHPLQVLMRVSDEAIPAVAALMRLHRDVGSCKATLLAPDVPPPTNGDDRMVCVGCVDVDDIMKLSRDLTRELLDDRVSAELASKVAVVELSEGLYVVVFRCLTGRSL